MRRSFLPGASGVAAFIAGVLSLTAPAIAESACDLEPGERSRVVSIIDGDTVVLEDGREIRLVGLQAPKLALGRRNFDDWPLAAEARDHLEALVLNSDVRLSYGGRREDRYGRLLAHLHLPDGIWVQGSMIADGMARVYSFPDNRACVGDLLQLERAARHERRQIWDDAYYSLLRAEAPEELLKHVDSFQIIEGTIRQAALVGGRLYLNFGEDWRDDFTITIAPRDVRHFPDDIGAYADTRIRVRGWLKSYNGPEIVVTHPEQIEFLSGFGRAS